LGAQERVDLVSRWLDLDDVRDQGRRPECLHQRGEGLLIDETIEGRTVLW
jgi:hypothetical protein